jgi:hypothetical protein
MTERFKKQRLSCCGYAVDSASVIGKEHAIPKAGDLSICMQCGGWHRYADDKGTLRPFRAEDFLDKDLDDETLALMRRATKAVQASRGKGK